MNINENTDFFQVVDNFAKTENTESICVFKAEDCCEAKITISIPTFKRVETLKESLESALNQIEYESYLIYVIDNNPERNDETELFMKQYKGGRVSYFKNAENLGLCGNWNRCISLPKTEWVCLLHDDDTIDSNFLKVMTPYLGTLPEVGILQSRKYRNRNNHICKQYSLPYERYSDLDYYFGNAIDVPSGIIYNRDKVIALGGFNNDYFPSLDSIFAAFMSFKYNTIVVNKELTWYREGIGNVSKAIETQKGWFCMDYYFTMFLLKNNRIPRLLSGIFTEYRCLYRAKADMKKWNTYFETPIEKLPWKGYGFFLGKIANRLLRKYVRYQHRRIQKEIK